MTVHFGSTGEWYNFTLFGRRPIPMPPTSRLPPPGPAWIAYRSWGRVRCDGDDADCGVGIIYYYGADERWDSGGRKRRESGFLRILLCVTLHRMLPLIG